MSTGRGRGLPAFSLGSCALVACNALIGNSGVSLWDDDAGGGIDSGLIDDEAASESGGSFIDSAASGSDSSAGNAESGSDADAGRADSAASSDDSDGSTPPSCAPGGPGMTNCGPSGTESCCASLAVEGSRVYRGGDYQNNTTTLHPASRVGAGGPAAYGRGVGVRCARTP
jgi:hypothetical protein